MNLSTIYQFAFICVPKTGSTSISRTIAQHCTINYGWKHSLKHMRTQVFHDHIMRFHRQLYPDIDIESFCIMRDPIDWVYSWYKFRSRNELKDYANNPSLMHRTEMYCGDISFEEFVRHLLQDKEKPKFAKIGTQGRYILLDSGQLGVDMVFKYENGMDPVANYLSEKIGEEVTIPRFNVSPERHVTFSDELRLQLEEKFSNDYQLYRNHAN